MPTQYHLPWRPVCLSQDWQALGQALRFKPRILSALPIHLAGLSSRTLTRPVLQYLVCSEASSPSLRA